MRSRGDGEQRTRRVGSCCGLSRAESLQVAGFHRRASWLDASWRRTIARDWRTCSCACPASRSGRGTSLSSHPRRSPGGGNRRVPRLPPVDPAQPGHAEPAPGFRGARRALTTPRACARAGGCVALAGLLPGHRHAHLALAVGDELAAEVDGDGVQVPVNRKGEPVVRADRRARGWRRRSAPGLNTIGVVTGMSFSRDQVAVDVELRPPGAPLPWAMSGSPVGSNSKRSSCRPAGTGSGEARGRWRGAT